MSESENFVDLGIGTGGGRGAFVVIVGPDGAGKTSLARVLLGRSGIDGRYFHFLPSPPGQLADGPPAHEELVEKRRGSGSRLLGLLRIGRNLIRAWLGYVMAIRPAVRAGKLVVGDRWLYGYIAQPSALRFHGPKWVARLVLRAMPRPDLLLLLEADAHTIHMRKPELTKDEIDSESALWRSLDQPVLRLDATRTPDRLAEIVMAHLRPNTDFVRYPPILGHVLLPSAPRSAALAGSDLYAPSRRRSYLSHRAGRVLIRAVGPRWLPPVLRDDLPLDAETWAALVQSLRARGWRVDEVALYTRTQASRVSFSVLVIDRGDPVTFVRIGPPEALDNECLAVSLLDDVQPQAFEFPRLLGRGSLGSLGYAAFSTVLSGPHRPSMNPPVEAIVAGIQDGLQGLPPRSGTPSHWRPMHGDFTPWNLRETRDQGPALIDWETAGWGPPGADEMLYYAASNALGLPAVKPPPNHEAAAYWIDRIEPSDDARDARLIRGLGRALAKQARE